MRNNLIGYVSDGENTMTGETGGLISYFRNIARKQPLHCMAIDKAYESIPYFAKFDKLINNLFKSYNKNSYKKKMRFKTAKRLNTTFYELNYIYRVRWISSEFQAISDFNKMWKLVDVDLSQIRDNRRNFDADVRNEASSHWQALKAKNF